MAAKKNKGESQSKPVLRYTQDGKTVVCVARQVVPIAVVKVSERGQISIPPELREKYDLSKGDRFLVEEVDGRIVLRPLPKQPLLELRGAFRPKTGSLTALPKGAAKIGAPNGERNDKESDERGA